MCYENKHRLHWQFIIISLLWLCSAPAEADCVYQGDGFEPAQPFNIQQPAVHVQRDAPVGTVISSFITNGTGDIDYCIGTGSIVYEMSMFSTPSTITNYYNTNVPGVGISLRFTSTNWYFPKVRQYSVISPTKTVVAPLEVTLIKTGDITSGVIGSGVLGKAYGDDRIQSLTVNYTGNQVTQLACSITTPNLSFPLGDISASNFGSTVGTVPSGAQNTQNLGLDCDKNANINVMLQGAQNPDVGATSVLALTGQGNSDVAKGVGVQLLYNGAPLELNNRIVLKQSAGGQETFPITARYYQTQPTVSTGKANASAILDLTYQ
ncbi:fimbrial protein [Enterobacter sp. GD03975]|uniref:fimbrial protein n=1 Tax=Enterobacter sp. GD03975 TaxID=2975412 RepID=UPI00244C3D2B|nr:fimbrial protein [Enterobacter sp. GD03975]MDH1125902.1 fimbrial protein [Enterobacter sp. GD03975]